MMFILKVIFPLELSMRRYVINDVYFKSYISIRVEHETLVAVEI